MIKRSKCKRIIGSRALVSASLYRLSRSRDLKPILGTSGLVSRAYSRSGPKSMSGSISGSLT